MRRLLPFLLIAVLAGVLAMVFWDGGESPMDGDGGADAAAASGLPVPAATLGTDAATSRSGVGNALIVRVVDADGRPADAALHLLMDGEASRIQAVRGSAQVLPAPQSLSVVAEAGGFWSEAAHWSASEPGGRDLLLTLDHERGASLSVQVRVDGEGPAAGAKLRVVDALSKDPWRRMFEGLAIRQTDAAREDSTPAETPQAFAEPEAEAQEQAAELPSAQRIARGSLAHETWTADAEGKVWIPGLQAGDWSFEARAPGCAPEYFELALAEGERAEREVLLQRSGVVAGRVLGPGNAPLAQAEIGLWPSLEKEEEEMLWFDPIEDFLRYGRLPASIPSELRTLCDAQGRFELTNVRAGNYLVLAKAEGVRPARSASFELEPRGRAELGDLQLARGHALVVSVKDPAGKPVFGAELSWRAGETVMGMITQGSEAQRTDADGRCTLAGLPSAELSVVVEHGDYAREKHGFSFLAGTETFPKSWEVTLRAGAILQGTVLSAGTPVARASLRVLPPREDSGMFSALFDGEAREFSGADGGFRFERLPPGQWRIGVEHEDHARLTTEVFELFEGENAPRILQLAAGGTLVVTVLDENGGPVEGAVVLAQETSDFQSESGTTDARGITLIEHLPAGSWRLMRVDQMQNANPQDLRLDLQFRFVMLEEGERREIQLGGPVQSAEVFGTVRMGGRALAKHSVVLVGNGGVLMERTDEDGLYRFDAVVLDDYMVTVTSTLGGGSSWSGALEVKQQGSLQHDIELPSSVVEVRVVDAGTGAPVVGVPVNLRPEDASTLTGGAFLKTDADGLVSFSMLTRGSYLAAVGNLAMPLLGGGEGLGSAMVEKIVVASENAGTQRVEVRLPQSAQLRVRVTGPDGQVLAGAHVHSLSKDGQSLNFFSTKGSNSKGVVELSGLAPGPQRFLARHPQIGSQEFEVTLLAGELVKHEVTLKSGVQLMVRVVDADGAPASGVFAVAMTEAGRPLFYFTMDESQEINQTWFSGAPQRVGPLAPGNYLIRLHRPGYPSVEHRVTVAASPAVQELRLRFAPE